MPTLPLCHFKTNLISISPAPGNPSETAGECKGDTAGLAWPMLSTGKASRPAWCLLWELGMRQYPQKPSPGMSGAHLLLGELSKCNAEQDTWGSSGRVCVREASQSMLRQTVHTSGRGLAQTNTSQGLAELVLQPRTAPPTLPSPVLESLIATLLPNQQMGAGWESSAVGRPGRGRPRGRTLLGKWLSPSPVAEGQRLNAVQGSLPFPA